MKVLAVLLLCAFVAVQGRSAVGTSSKSLAVQGDNPWFVHLRIAISTSGLLETGAGTLISERYVITSGDVLRGSRFIWIRYDVVNVVNPGMVTEASIVRYSDDANMAIININRIVQFTTSIFPIKKIGGEASDTAVFYAFGSNEEGNAGEVLKYFTVTLEKQEDNTIIASSDEGKATRFDLGAPLVSDGALVGVLVKEGGEDNAGEFASTANYLDWIESETGLDLGTSQPEESVRVQFVN